jgi:hypothetical protein
MNLCNPPEADESVDTSSVFPAGSSEAGVRKKMVSRRDAKNIYPQIHPPQADYADYHRLEKAHSSHRGHRSLKTQKVCLSSLHHPRFAMLCISPLQGFRASREIEIHSDRITGFTGSSAEDQCERPRTSREVRLTSAFLLFAVALRSCLLQLPCALRR